GIEARTTGIMHEFARSEDRIAVGQIQGLGFALLAVAGILLAIFGWPRLAAVALLPNALPVLIAFGAMGLMGVALDAGTVFVGNLALGIAIDDTIHETAEFFRRRALGQEPELALRGALARMLRPVVYTTLIVTAGFAVLGLSSFTFTRNLGLLTAGVMVLCLLADLLLLPALLLRLEARKELVSAEVV
ncbi:MAG: RND transporter, partial [Deltaproteobacteria bacterium]|nr:RND transporter [Deltaproteobacteria bacterium]